MSTELIINATLPETRIALLEDGEIQEMLIERDSEKGIVGNIYKGRVLRVLPGMQAAFVDIGHEKAAFLYVDDVFFADMDTPMATNALTDDIHKQDDESPAQIVQPNPNRIVITPPKPSVAPVVREVAREMSRDQRGGRGERDRGRGGRGRDRDRGGKRHDMKRVGPLQKGGQRGGATPNFVPGSPEEHAWMQRQYGQQMMDISEEDYLAEMERVRRSREAGGAQDKSEAAPPAVASAIEKPVVAPVVTPVERKEPEVFAQAAEPGEADSPPARGFVQEEPAEAEEDVAQSAAIYRPEPIVDLDAWVHEIAHVQADHDPDGAELTSAEAAPQAPEAPAASMEQVPRTLAEVAADAVAAEKPVEQPAQPAPIGRERHPHRGRHGGHAPGQRHGRGRRSEEMDDDSEVVQKRRRHEPVNIADLVKEGQEILVQVAKDPIATKGARLTCHVSLPGRYLVFMPSVDHVGVSRRIENDVERRRLKETISHIRPAKTGVIVRTASGKQTDMKLKADLDYLVEAWNEIQRKFKKQRSPTVLYQDLTIALRSIRDMVNDEVDKVVIDSKREFKSVSKFVTRFMPVLKDKLELYEGAMPIFDHYGIETEIERALERRVWLKSGGYIVVDQAEALVAIDVNTGRYVGKKNLEETILKTNLEAVEEIAYQLRIRNCGGIIILDLIDMEKDSHKEKVYKALEEALKKDRARPTIMRISQLGLVEMTRKRTRDTIVRSLCQPCTQCKGRSFVKNPLTISYDILRDIEREGYDKETTAVSIQCHPEVADILEGEKSDVLQNLEQEFGKKISVRANGAYPLEQYELVTHREGKADVSYTSEERRQQLRQKVSARLQQMATEQRKAAEQERQEKRQSREEESRERNEQRRAREQERLKLRQQGDASAGPAAESSASAEGGPQALEGEGDEGFGADVGAGEGSRPQQRPPAEGREGEGAPRRGRRRGRGGRGRVPHPGRPGQGPHQGKSGGHAPRDVDARTRTGEEHGAASREENAVDRAIDTGAEAPRSEETGNRDRDRGRDNRGRDRGPRGGGARAGGPGEGPPRMSRGDMVLQRYRELEKQEKERARAKQEEQGRGSKGSEGGSGAPGGEKGKP
ncbi:MAG: Rne/Rng family ribonuclease [Deltaproteobacteria bacterium]|nr:Rne/Rng family ribonuclease [Deltaproteobacteria bacterium]